MEIHLDFKASRIINILDSLYVVENKENFDKAILEVLPYSPNKRVEKYIQELSRSKRIDKKRLNFFFHTFFLDEQPFSIIDCLDIHNVKDMSFATVDEYLSKLRNRSEEQILQKIVSFLACSKEKGNSEGLIKYEEIYKNKSKMLDLLKKSNTSGEAKWNLYMIINETTYYMNEFCKFIEDFLPIFDKAFEILNSSMEKFNNYVSDRINKEQAGYLTKLPDFGIDKYENVIISTMTVNYASLLVGDIDDTAYLYIGMDIEKVLDSVNGKSEEDVLLNLLKTISDNSRFSILKELEHGELFGIELAEKLGLTTATISHHINSLILSKLIDFNRKDGKVYYKLNKQPLRDMINSITKKFNL